MPRCYMCPEPTIWEEIQYTTEPCFTPARNRILCCDDTYSTLPLRRHTLKPTLANLETLLQKLFNHLDVINEEMKVYTKVNQGIRECLTELHNEILAERAEAVVRLPRYIRRSLREPLGDGVDVIRGAALMTKKQMLITQKKLRAQLKFVTEQFGILIRARRKLITAITERKKMLRTLAGDTNANSIIKSPVFHPTPPLQTGESHTFPFVGTRNRFSQELKPRSVKREKLPEYSSCQRECVLRSIYEQCSDAFCSVREAVKMSLYRRGKIAEIVHEMFRLYSNNNQLISSAIEFGKYYGVGCGGGGDTRRQRDVFVVAE